MPSQAKPSQAKPSQAKPNQTRAHDDGNLMHYFSASKKTTGSVVVFAYH
jgi:hypothetical protein